MLSGLTAAFKSGLELTAPSRYDQDSNVGLRGAADHVGHETLVARRVQNNKMLVFGLEEGAAHLDRLALLALLLIRVQSPRQVPGLAILLLGFALILLKRALVHHAGEEHDLAADGRLARVYVTAKYHIDCFLFGLVFADDELFLGFFGGLVSAALRCFIASN